jgi:putative Mg2+ transporter-C (MgtC) family protein
MTEYVLTQLEYLLKLILAGICGAVIGYERKNHLKEAGVRTHMLVAIGSSLIMIISKYGFGDMLEISGYNLDPSRIAAQIVTGIGFLGAGMIFVRRQTINGLTTAAGIWATAGIGMAIGTNLYVAGVAATILVFLVQVVLYRNYKWLRIPSVKQVSIHVDTSPDAIACIQNKLRDNELEIIDFKATKTEEGLIHLEVYIKIPPDFQPAQLLNLFCDNPHIVLIEI